MTGITATTNAGSQYKVLQLPSNVTYTVASATSNGRVDGENEYWTVYIPVSEVREKSFPLNANPRKPNSIGTNESRDIVVKMRSTLTREPKKFVRLNNGFTCVCSSFNYDAPSKTIQIQWSEGEGILNGGHSYLAIQTLARDVDAVVRAEIIVINPTLQANESAKTKFITETAIARNSNRQLKDFTRSEFEGKHEVLQSHLMDLKGVVYWSEGYEELSVSPHRFTSSDAMKANEFVRYLALLDLEWHWHPSKKQQGGVNPREAEILNNLIVSGNKTYDQWSVIALDDENDKNLHSVAPLGPDLLKLVDMIRLSMNNPTAGYGPNFVSSPFYASWAGKGQTAGRTFSDMGLRRCPKSSPHFIAYMLNWIRPYIWFGETENHLKMVGYYRDPFEVYNEIHPEIIKYARQPFQGFKTARDFANSKSSAASLWREVVKDHWSEAANVDDSESENFWPIRLYCPDYERWFKKDVTGQMALIYDDDLEEWSLTEFDLNLHANTTIRRYSEIR